MFFNEEHIAIKHHPLIGQWIKSEKIKFTKYRKLEIAFNWEDQKTYFDAASKSLFLKTKHYFRAILS